MDERVVNMPVSRLIEDGEKAVDIIRSYDSDVIVSFIGERTRENVRIMTSRGANADYERMYYSYGVHTELIEEQNILQISKYAKGIRPPRSAEDTAKEIVENLRIGRKNVSFKPGKMTVVFAPTALADVLMAFTGIRGRRHGS